MLTLQHDKQVWVRKRVLEEALKIEGRHGHLSDRNRLKHARQHQDSLKESDDRNWDWCFAVVLSRSTDCNKEFFDRDENLTLLVQDEYCSHLNGMTIKVPSSTSKNGGIVLCNHEFNFNGNEGNAGENLADLDHSHEPGVIYYLRKRYSNDLIYTMAGPVLLAINPFKNCDELYNEYTIRSFLLKQKKNS